VVFDLRLASLQERGVEGIHARVTQKLGGRPLSAPGLGVELKWPHIEDMFNESPEAWPGLAPWLVWWAWQTLQILQYISCQVCHDAR